MRTDYVSRITPPVSQHEPGSVYDRIMTAIHMSRKRNRNDFTGLIFKDAYDLFYDCESKIRVYHPSKEIIKDILENPIYTPLHGMVMACLCSAFSQNDEILEFLIANVKDQTEFVHFKPIIDYYRSKRILDDYADKERIEHIRSLEQKQKELDGRLIGYELQIAQLKEENDALRESQPSKQENILSLEDILDYMLSTKKIEFCGQIATMLNHFSRSLTEDGWKQVLAVENELRNGSLINVVNNNHIEGSYVNQGVIKDSKFSKVK